jgi:TRAP-type mannitol/chloroaromatic compound transport system permease small subunit
MIAYFGWFATLRSFGSGEIRQGQLGFPVWPARMALALGASLMVLQCLIQFLSTLRALLRGNVASAVLAPATDLTKY